MNDVEKQLDDSLDRLAGLIDELAQSKDPDDMKQAIVAASQLARIQERVAEARRDMQPVEKEREPMEVSQKQRLESLRALLHRHAEELGYERVIV